MPVRYAVDLGEVRKALKTKGSFPSEDAARKLIYLAIQNAVPQWTRTRGWTKALLAFKIQLRRSATRLIWSGFCQVGCAGSVRLTVEVVWLVS
jgi:hypothetical protein